VTPDTPELAPVVFQLDTVTVHHNTVPVDIDPVHHNIGPAIVPDKAVLVPDKAVLVVDKAVLVPDKAVLVDKPDMDLVARLAAAKRELRTAAVVPADAPVALL
jgi:hypothetical protein